MIRAYVAAVEAGDVSHPGDELFTRQVENARRRPVQAFDEEGQRLWTISKDYPASPAKIDAMAAAALSWQARSDAISMGAAEQRRKSAYADQVCRCGNPATPHLKRLHR
jgi:hypothetical protein